MRTVELNPKYFRRGVIPEGAELQNILERRGRGGGVWLQVGIDQFVKMRDADRRLSFKQRLAAIPPDQISARAIKKQGSVLALLAKNHEGDVAEFRKDGIWYYALILPYKTTGDSGKFWRTIGKEMKSWTDIGWVAVPDEYIGRTITLELKDLLSEMGIKAILITSAPKGRKRHSQLEVATNKLLPKPFTFDCGAALVLITPQKTSS